MIAASASDWFGTDLSTLAYIALTAVGIYAAVIALVRINGLRSFSQMSAFDFATTVAMGTIVASTAVSSEISLPEGATAVLVLLSLQSLVSLARRRLGFGAIVDNTPRVIMRDGEVLAERLAAANLTRADLMTKLRENGVSSLDQVKIVVMETTGAVTVIKDEGRELDARLLEGVEQ